MNYDDPAVLDVVRRSMVARIATLSRNGRPSVTPLYFVCLSGQIWLGTADWTLAARDVKADPRVSVLFEVEQRARDRRIVRITGRASVRTDARTYAAYVLRVAFKYSLTPGQLRNTSSHLGLLLLRRRYHAQSAQKGRACIIDVTAEQADLLND